MILKKNEYIAESDGKIKQYYAIGFFIFGFTHLFLMLMLLMAVKTGG